MPARLETYVEELRRELSGLPVTQRAEQLAEVRAHLNELRAANIELGLTDEEAEAAAISQLGGAKALGRATRRATWRDHWDTAPGVAWVFGVFTWLPTLLMSTPGEGNVCLISMPTEWSSIGGIVALSFALGVALARLFPRYAVRGSLLALGGVLLSELLFTLVRGGFPVYIHAFHGIRLVMLMGAVAGTYLSPSRRRLASG